MLGLGDYMDVTCQAFIGGTAVDANIQQLRSGVQVVVGTPGRVFHMLERSALRALLTPIGFLFSTMMSFFRDQVHQNVDRGRS